MKVKVTKSQNAKDLLKAFKIEGCFFLAKYTNILSLSTGDMISDIERQKSKSFGHLIKNGEFLLKFIPKLTKALNSI